MTYKNIQVSPTEVMVANRFRSIVHEDIPEIVYRKTSIKNPQRLLEHGPRNPGVRDLAFIGDPVSIRTLA